MIILVVDDNESIRKCLKKKLNLLNHDVIVCDNGLSGIETFEKNQQDIDCVITDYCMPGINGEEMARKIKELNQNIPIVLFTTNLNNINDNFFDFWLGKTEINTKLIEILHKILVRIGP